MRVELLVPVEYGADCDRALSEVKLEPVSTGSREGLDMETLRQVVLALDSAGVDALSLVLGYLLGKTITVRVDWSKGQAVIGTLARAIQLVASLKQEQDREGESDQ